MNSLNDTVASPENDQHELVIASEVVEELFVRLAWMTINPATVLCLGGGELRARLQQRFPDAEILSDAAAMASVDVIVANMWLPWQADIKKVFQTWWGLLRPNGLLMLSTLGLDTLKECQTIVEQNALPQLVDMHDIGDGLLAAGFSDPVLDVDYYTTVYRSKEKLINELYASRMLCSAPSAEQIDTNEITYEVIFAHAFAPLHKERNIVGEDGVVKVPLSQLRRMR